MTFSILDGAYVNSGDFLIVERTKRLLLHIYPDAKIVSYKRRYDLSEHLDEINKSDALIIAGGPAYRYDMHPEIMPLVDDLDKIKTKIVTIGVGWKGSDTSPKTIKKYRFSDTTRRLLNRLSKDSKDLSCRDIYTVDALCNSDYNNAVLHGCPAWYNLDKIGLQSLREGINYDFKKICVSDPTIEMNYNQCIELLQFLTKTYKNAEIHFVFHSIHKETDKYSAFVKALTDLNITMLDIKGSVDGFSVYDDCDLHIGYRVHAHIYNLSYRNISILIEEDGRGSGVNDTLGLSGIRSLYYIKKSKATNKFTNKVFRFLAKRIEFKDKNFLNKLSAYLEEDKKNAYSQYADAFSKMQSCFGEMEKYIRSIGEN